MLAANLLAKKREGHDLTDEEIVFLIRGFCDGTVADYQMSALAMAICIRGMTARETMCLTQAMLDSGERLSREGSDRRGRPRVDKHSTGGLGDKVSLILAPLLAACDVDVPMISGRGLGLTGGTLDKLESIPGFRTELSEEQGEQVLESAGAFIVSASQSVAPADRKLYALRDVTGTVKSNALITASILSKKLAANLDALVMDVKVGEAAFMKTPDEARELASSLIRVGAAQGLPTQVLMTDMDQPLGRAVGNAIEVNEALDVLSGDGPAEVRELTLQLAARLLVQSSIVSDPGEARRRLNQTLDSGLARQRFEEMVQAQGGRIDSPLPIAPPQRIAAASDGYVRQIDCRKIGSLVVQMGGGRRRAGDPIDHSVGVAVHVRVGDIVQSGQSLLTVHCHRSAETGYVREIQDAIMLTDAPVAARPLIIESLDDAGN